MTPAARLAMFPLGTVLFPHGVLPIHVFEPRYRRLVADCLEGAGEFGVVLIERGSEVGGGDTRFVIGTVARIVEAARIADGRFVLATVGTARLRVLRWLDDAPYPSAEVERLDDPVAEPDDAARRDAVQRSLRRVLGLAAELGASGVPADVNLSTEPGRAAFEACSLAPLGPLDAQHLLELDSPRDRLDRLVALLDEEAMVLEHRLSGA